MVVPVAYPETTHGVHVSTAAWANDELRAGIEDLIDRGLVDTVELDLKDESGIIGYDSELAQAQEIGAVTADYDLSETVEYLKGKGIRVIGRLVAFRDPIYANAAWAAGDPRSGRAEPVGWHVLELRRVNEPTKRCVPTTGPSPSRRSRWV